ncbi:ash family protein [Rahnella sp. FC061912-K]|nr:ash family protein [Rahnella rivi]
MRHSVYAPAKSGAGIGLLKSTKAHDTPMRVFLFVRHSLISMVGWAGASSEAPGPL